MDKILANLKHLPSTVGGVAVGVVTFVLANSDAIQQITSINPKLASYGMGVIGLATSLGLILGVGPKEERSK